MLPLASLSLSLYRSPSIDNGEERNVRLSITLMDGLSLTSRANHQMSNSPRRGPRAAVTLQRIPI